MMFIHVIFSQKNRGHFCLTVFYVALRIQLIASKECMCVMDNRVN